ncbi:MAG: hypothetical protein QXG81_03900 [Ignisphaera sp.]
MSLVRDFSNLFISRKEGASFSLYTKMLLLTVLLVEVTISITLFKESNIVFTVYSIALLFALTFWVGGFKRVLNALKLPLIFVLIGFATMLFSVAMGYAAPSPKAVILSTAKITALFLIIALGFQWISLRELRWVLSKAGLGSIASLTTVVLTLIPAVLNLYSEAYTATLLKYGKRYAYKALKPLIIHSILFSRDVAQAVYWYGLPQIPRVKINRPRRTEVLVVLAIGAIGIYTMFAAP